MIAVLTIVYIQYNYLQTDWCSTEIDILRSQLSDLWYMYDLDIGVANEPR
jgi:hypothetical protein